MPIAKFMSEACSRTNRYIYTMGAIIIRSIIAAENLFQKPA
jgi:hypothetical protein